MKFRSETFLPHPRAAVYEAYRDRLPEVVPWLDDIAAVNVLARDEADGVVTLHNEWVSDAEVPKVAQSFVKQDDLKWDDHATWKDADWACSWDIKTRVMTDAVTCTGTTSMVEKDGGTMVVLQGDFTVNVKEIPGVPRFLAGRVAPQVEKFIIQMIQPNLEKTTAAVGKFLDAQG